MCASTRGACFFYAGSICLERRVATICVRAIQRPAQYRCGPHPKTVSGVIAFSLRRLHTCHRGWRRRATKASIVAGLVSGHQINRWYAMMPHSYLKFDRTWQLLITIYVFDAGVPSAAYSTCMPDSCVCEETASDIDSADQVRWPSSPVGHCRPLATCVDRCTGQHQHRNLWR